MNTKFFDKVFRIFFILAFVLGAVWIPTAQVSAQNPFFIVRLNYNYVATFDWPHEVPITLTIDDPNTPEVVDYTETRTLPLEYSNSFSFNPVNFTIRPGQTVTVTDGTITETHIVMNLTADDVNTETDMVFGTADAGTYVYIAACGEAGCGYTGSVIRRVISDFGGHWSADFAHPGIGDDEQALFDIGEGTRLEISQQVPGEANSTSWTWDVPNPSIITSGNNLIHGYDWPLGASVTLRVDNPGNGTGVDYAATQIARYEYWANAVMVTFNMPSNFQFFPGYILMMTDENTIETYTVGTLAVTNIDSDADTISGQADPGTSVMVWMEGGSRTVTSGQDGNWFADFNVPGTLPGEENTFDILPGTRVLARVRNSDGNGADYWTSAPAPTLWVFPANNVVYAFGWDPGKLITLTVDDPTNGIGIDYTFTDANDHQEVGMVGPDVAVFEIGDQVGSFSGKILTATDGEIAQTYIVKHLTIDQFDLEADTISGSADPGAEIEISGWSQGGFRRETADTNGNWTADFSVPGETPDEFEVVDLLPGMGGMVYESDGNNLTRINWETPNPVIAIWKPNLTITSDDWPVGIPIQILVDNPDTPQNPDFSDTDYSEVFFEIPAYPDRTILVWDAPDPSTIQPGYEVTVTNGITTQEIIVSAVQITDVDIEADTVNGIAEPFAMVNVQVDYSYELGRTVYANEQGYWIADFSITQEGGPPGSNVLYDIVQGTRIRAFVHDVGGDGSTAWVWDVRTPRIEARVTENLINGNGWQSYLPVNLTIEDTNLPGTPIATMDSHGDGDGNVQFDLSQYGILLRDGYTVTMTDGYSSRSLAIPFFGISEINRVTDTITGFAPAGEQVRVWDNYGGGDRRVTTGPDGIWIANFALHGDDPINQPAFDILYGQDGGAEIADADGDTVNIYWALPVPDCQPGDSVSGTVFEHDGITPVPSAQVQIEDFTTGEPLFVTSGNQNGQFACALPDGDYRIMASGINFSSEYYNNVEDPNLAAKLQITTGTQLTGINFTLSPMVILEHMTFNSQNPFLQDRAIRQAIALGTDRARILNEAFLPNNIYGMVVNSILPPEHWASAPSSELDLYPYDPVQARAILDAAGWIDRDSDGFRENMDGAELAFSFKTRPVGFRIASSMIFQENMAEIGIRIQPEYYSNLGEFLGAHDFDIAEFAWVVSLDDASTLDTYIVDSPVNYGSYNNPTYDTAVASANAATGNAAKLPYLIEAQQIFMHDLPVLPLFTRYNVTPVTTPTGSNVSVSPESYLEIKFEEVTQEGVTTALATEINPADLPPNFQLLGKVYDIGSNAQFTNAQVCFTYDDTGLLPEQESAIRLFHLENNIWTDVTDNGYPDTATNKVCGTVTGFSPFAVMYRLNQPPVISALATPLNPVQLGQSINATVLFTDPDVGDTHTFAWTWGDGSTTNGSGASASHLYTQTGVYTISVTVTDAAGESASVTAQQYVVVYDPSGGFVTGGGWILSPAGAYTADPSLTGKATFGFVSKYQKGANVPTGNTEFQFQVANLNFKSTAYEWLVIAGTKALYKGSGTINGAGNFGFMLSAIDGAPDMFRIKIWNKESGVVVYDNMLGAAEDASPTTAIGGGSIIIHK